MCSLYNIYTMNIITSVHRPSTGSKSLLIAVHIYSNDVKVQYFKIPTLVIVLLFKEKLSSSILLKLTECGSNRWRCNLTEEELEKKTGHTSLSSNKMAHFKYIYIKFLQIKCQTKYCTSQNGKKKKERKQASHESIALRKSQSNVNSPRLKHPNLGTATKQALDGARGRKHLDWYALNLQQHWWRMVTLRLWSARMGH